MGALVARIRFVVVGYVLPVVLHLAFGVQPLVLALLCMAAAVVLDRVMGARGGASCLGSTSAGARGVAGLWAGLLFIGWLVLLVAFSDRLIATGIDSFTLWWAGLALVMAIVALAQYALGGTAGVGRRRHVGAPGDASRRKP